MCFVILSSAKRVSKGARCHRALSIRDHTAKACAVSATSCTRTAATPAAAPANAALSSGKT